MKSFFFCALLILLVVSRSPLTTSEEYDDERDWDYLEDSGKGPEHWGDLNENWTICKNGTRQSPINLRDGWVDARPLGRLQTSYMAANATLLNRGHDIMPPQSHIHSALVPFDVKKLKWVNYAGSLHIDGTDYELMQCHWHSPSEHIVNGHRLDLEVHMVHLSLDGKIAVVGALYKIDEIFLREDPFIGKLRAPLDVLADGNVNETVAGVVHPYDLIMDGGREYYRYMGSLTTPPCTEGVVWTVLKEPCIRPVSFDQVKKLRDAVHDYARSNARPIQQFNGRELLLNEQGCHPTTLQSI